MEHLLAMERPLATELPVAIRHPLVTPVVVVVTPPPRAVKRARGSEAGLDRRESAFSFPLEGFERFRVMTKGFAS
jgi:hypothetical protein